VRAPGVKNSANVQIAYVETRQSEQDAERLNL
jgi:hypothetical protein